MWEKLLILFITYVKTGKLTVLKLRSLGKSVGLPNCHPSLKYDESKVRAQRDS